MLWQLPTDFKARITVLVAGGPSLSLPQVRQIGMARARGAIRVIAINDAVYPCWFADLLYACDPVWWKHHDGVPGFDGYRVTLKRDADPTVPMVDHMRNTGTEGFDPDPTALRAAGNSGYQALHLCAHLKVDRAILVGFDMRGTHWFGDHPPGVHKTYPPGHDRRIKAFRDLVAPLAERDITVVNATPGSALDAFPRGDLETELERAR